MQQLPYRHVLIFFILLLSACGRAVRSTPAPTPTAVIRPTLPPTWTPTHTPTPLPATATASRTPRPTITPTLSEAAICAQLGIMTNLRDGRSFNPGDDITLFHNALPLAGVVRFVATHQTKPNNIGAELPGDGANILQLAVNRLGATGVYDWSLLVRTDELGDICIQSGTFRLLAPGAGREELRPPR